MEKLGELYSGKVKTLFNTTDPDHLILHFRDDTTAFNGVKFAQLTNKGIINNHFNAFLMEKLAKAGIPTHFERNLGNNESFVKRLTMIPIECVIRNYAAGNLCKRLGIEKGLKLDPPLFEFFLKSDALNDPMITEEHIHAFKYATEADIKEMKTLTHEVNRILVPLFADAGLLLVDFKLEFGRFQGKLYLGDEFTPDGCRVWDAKTHEILDKDRFRQDLGNVIESYEIIAKKLGMTLPV